MLFKGKSASSPFVSPSATGKYAIPFVLSRSAKRKDGILSTFMTILKIKTRCWLNFRHDLKKKKKKQQ
jgi:hypothetical protein